MKYFDAIAMGLPIARKSKPSIGFLIPTKGGHLIKKTDGSIITLDKEDYEASDWVAGDIEDIFLSIPKSEFIKVASDFFANQGVVNEYTADALWETLEGYCSGQLDVPEDDEED